MFQGKFFLDAWLADNRDEVSAILHAYPRDKIEKVYYYFFNLMCKMQWGQWFVIEKMCPNLSDRLLLNFVLEFIYQGSLLAEFELQRISPTETRVCIMEPTDEIKQRCDILLGRSTYLLVDWYGRIKRNDLDGTNIDRSILFPDDAPSTPTSDDMVLSSFAAQDPDPD